MTEEKKAKLMPVKDLLKGSGEKEATSAEEAEILYPRTQKLRIADREFTLRKPRIRDLRVLAKELAEVFWTVFAAQKGQAGGPLDSMMAVLPSITKVMAWSLGVEEDWLDENAELVHVTDWLQKFTALHSDSELRAIHANFTQIVRRLKLAGIMPVGERSSSGSAPSTVGQSGRPGS